MERFDLRHIVSEQQELIIQVKPAATVRETYFEGKKQSRLGNRSRVRLGSGSDTGDASIANSRINREGGNKEPEVDEETVNESTVEGASAEGQSIESSLFTEAFESASVASAELRIRDILSEQLLSIEARKERERQERLLQEQEATSKFLVTHNFNEYGEPVFESRETPINPAEKYIPIAFVKKQSSQEEILYR
jgi:hypothetical protein